MRLNRSATRPCPWKTCWLARRGSAQLVVYATFIVALVFVPLLTLGGVAGKLFAPLGIAYIFAIMASLIVAVTLTPALCYLLLARVELKVEDPPFVRWLKPRYLGVLQRIERFPGRLLAATAVAIVAGIAAAAVFRDSSSSARGHYSCQCRPCPHFEAEPADRQEGVGSHRLDQSRAVRGPVGGLSERLRYLWQHYSEFEIELGALPGRDQARSAIFVKPVWQRGFSYPG